jgi:hypothetical protein
LPALNDLTHFSGVNGHEPSQGTPTVTPNIANLYKNLGKYDDAIE